MSKYLYGASVQGIQGFIFATNKLQEIVGASEIVKSVAGDFDKRVKDFDVEVLVNAAGNIKALFTHKEECQKVVLDFAKEIEQKAYGITISQSVVQIEGNKETQNDIDLLEKNLKTQRNKPSIPLDLSLNIMKLEQRTARPLILDDADQAIQQKRKAYAEWFKNERIDEEDFEKSKELSFISNGKKKIAVIHADGNGLGKLVPELKEKLSAFSVALDEATRQAFESAKTENMKIREVILGGDDLTVICDANEALPFIEKYLKNFEENTKNITELEGLTEKLTACAGIAFTNEKYPFHYAVSLAEALCSEAKKHSEREASCVMFYNIQSSNFQNWDKFVKDELTIINDKETIRCDFGPYYLDTLNQPSIKNFMHTVEAYRCDGSPISRLREWLGELNKSKTYSDNLLKRINETLSQNSQWNSCAMELNLSQLYTGLSNDKLYCNKDQEKDCKGVEKELLKTPIYDVLQILSVTEAK